jgi:hypothetical protein
MPLFSRKPSPSDEPSWEGVAEFLFCDLVTDEVRGRLPADAAILSIAGQLVAYFYYCRDYEEPGITVTAGCLARWGVTLKQLADTTGWKTTAVWDWPAVKEGVRLFQYPDKDSHWINHIIAPGCLLEHTDVPAPAVIMAPHAKTVFIAGLPDVEAQQLMLEQCAGLCRKKQPLLTRPLVIGKDWKSWSVLPDSRNPLAEEYRRAFGESQVPQ